jgi:hypothetical protein
MSYLDGQGRGELVEKKRDAGRTRDLAHWAAIIFVSLELPGQRPVSSRKSRLSQAETISSFETVEWGLAGQLELGFGGREFSGRNRIDESTGLMRTIAKRLVCRMSAAAEADNRPASQAEGFSFGIKDLEFAFDADRTVVIDSDPDGRHLFS